MSRVQGHGRGGGAWYLHNVNSAAGGHIGLSLRHYVMRLKGSVNGERFRRRGVGGGVDKGGRGWRWQRNETL